MNVHNVQFLINRQQRLGQLFQSSQSFQSVDQMRVVFYSVETDSWSVKIILVIFLYEIIKFSLFIIDIIRNGIIENDIHRIAGHAFDCMLQFSANTKILFLYKKCWEAILLKRSSLLRFQSPHRNAENEFQLMNILDHIDLK